MGCFAPELDECLSQCTATCPPPLVCEDGWCVQPGSHTECAITVEPEMPAETGHPDLPVPDGGPPIIESFPSFCPEVRVASSRVLPLACAGTDYSTRLSAGCAREPFERSVRWRARRCSEPAEAGCLPEWLELTDDGRLSGQVPAGEATHRFELSVVVDTGSELTQVFELEASEHCWVFELSDDEAQRRIVGSRIDQPDTRVVAPESMPDAFGVREFRLSPNGRYLAAVVAPPSGEGFLDVYALGPSGLALLSRSEGLGVVADAAFSPDSAWLAAVARVAVSSNLPASSNLILASLGDSVSFGEPRAIDYVSSLHWTGPSRLLYLGRSVQRASLIDGAPLHTPHEVAVSAAGIDAAAAISEIPSLALETLNDSFQRFLVNPGGLFMQTTQSLLYFDRCLARSFQALIIPIEIGHVAPTLDWVGTTLDGELLLQHYGSLPGADMGCRAFAERRSTNCEQILAWSADGSSLLCLSQARLELLRTDAATLAATTIGALASYAPVRERRRALSRTGRWLALLLEPSGADPRGGLVVVPTSGAAAAPPAPLLRDESDAPFWDFAFTPDERHLIVQQGPRLFVLDDFEGAGSEPVLLSTSVVPARDCSAASLPDSRLWCGAPELMPGTLVPSPSGRFLAHDDASGLVEVTDVSGERRSFELGQRSSGCPAPLGCVQFQ
jgi:hypothetical protein